MSRRLELGEATWQGWELSGKPPKGEVLLSLMAMGVSADWLLSGDGAMWLGDKKFQGRKPDIDSSVLSEIIRLVGEWLRDNGRTLPPEKMGEVVATLYDVTMEDASESGPRQVSRQSVATALRLVA